MIVFIRSMFNTPAIPFAERMIGPIPAVRFENTDHIIQVLVSTGRPSDGAKLTHIHVNAITSGEVDSRAYRLFQGLYMANC